MALNKVMLLGNLGKDPEMRMTPQQLAITTFSLATGERRKDAATGEWKEHTEWHNIVVFGKSAENSAKYLKKGSQCFIEGRIQTRKWQDKEGKDRYTTEIVAETVQFVGARNSDGAGQRLSDDIQVNQTGGYKASNSVLDSLPSAEELASKMGTSTFDDDDIPF